MKAHFENEGTFENESSIRKMKAHFETHFENENDVFGKVKSNQFVYNCVFQLNLFDLIPQDLY